MLNPAPAMAFKLLLEFVGMLIRVRFHGRGGQGAKIASRILGRSGFLSGMYAQDSALFGAERRGAPVISFTRLSNEPIEERGHVNNPSLVMVMDPSLLEESPDQVFLGVNERTPVFVNSSSDRPAVKAQDVPPISCIFMDLSSIAREVTGTSLVSAAAAAAAAKCVSSINLAALEEAVRLELTEFGVPTDLIEKNVAMAGAAYQRTPGSNLAVQIALERPSASSWQTVPHPSTVHRPGPTIRRPGSAALRRTGNWKIERPEIDLTKCKRCFLCYLYCPEAAMRLDSDDFPRIDYDHCKGCMICYRECPTDAISRKLAGAM